MEEEYPLNFPNDSNQNTIYYPQFHFETAEISDTLANAKQLERISNRQLQEYENSRKLSSVLKYKLFKSYIKHRKHNLKGSRSFAAERRKRKKHDEAPKAEEPNMSSLIQIEKCSKTERPKRNIFITNAGSKRGKPAESSHDGSIYMAFLRKKMEMDQKILSFNKIYEHDDYHSFNKLKFLAFEIEKTKPKLNTANVKIDLDFPFSKKQLKRSQIEEFNDITENFRNTDYRKSLKELEDDEDFLYQISHVRAKPLGRTMNGFIGNPAIKKGYTKSDYCKTLQNWVNKKDRKNGKDSIEANSPKGMPFAKTPRTDIIDDDLRIVSRSQMQKAPRQRKILDNHLKVQQAKDALETHYGNLKGSKRKYTSLLESVKSKQRQTSESRPQPKVELSREFIIRDSRRSETDVKHITEKSIESERQKIKPIKKPLGQQSNEKDFFFDLKGRKRKATQLPRLTDGMDMTIKEQQYENKDALNEFFQKKTLENLRSFDWDKYQNEMIKKNHRQFLKDTFHSDRKLARVLFQMYKDEDKVKAAFREKRLVQE